MSNHSRSDNKSQLRDDIEDDHMPTLDSHHSSMEDDLRVAEQITKQDHEVHQANLDSSITFGKFAMIFLKKSFAISIMRSLPMLQNIMFYYWIGLFKQEKFTGAYGLCMSLMMFINIILSSNGVQCTGVYISKFMGAGQ